jgi:hypothetical protein
MSPGGPSAVQNHRFAKSETFHGPGDNVDFERWGDYLADGPLAMAFLDRLVEGAIILKVKGKSYRAPQTKGGEDKPA